MTGLLGAGTVPVPEKWRRESFFGRLVVKGLCSYAYLASSDTPVKNVFGLLRMLDFDDYLERASVERERGKRGHR